ncbi:MAG: 4-hydroxy-tetrahydrodipicolinate synthase [Kiritimatiellia bacterium]|jgi:4-hydroxy-tetrahydrodipicolinate synthase
MKLQGTYTAIVTPFNQDGSIDYGRFRALIDEQAAAGIEGIVPVGSTGESPTLTYAEHIDVIRACAEHVAGRMQVIGGTGANSTAEAISLTKHILDAGVDATLQVAPYYNKPNAEGMYRHFAAVADLGLPVVLYNVPGRCGREIALETVVRLSKHPNVVAIKEAAGSVDRASAIRDACDLAVLSGDDSLAVPMLSVGASGLISVASNVIPKDVGDMVRAALEGDFAKASALHARCYPLFRDLFIDTNPVPVKTLLAMMGRIGETFRLPLCEPSAAVRDRIRATATQLGLLK